MRNDTVQRVVISERGQHAGTTRTPCSRRAAGALDVAGQVIITGGNRGIDGPQRSPARARI